jgi:hypothetical protein
MKVMYDYIFIVITKIIKSPLFREALKSTLIVIVRRKL